MNRRSGIVRVLALISRNVFLLLLLIASFTKLAAEQPKRVGLTLPLTGGLAAYGNAFKRGLELFKEENPQIVSDIAFILDDSQYDGAGVASSVRKLANIDKSQLLFVWGITPSQVAAPIAQQLRIPLIAMTTDPVSKGRSSVVSLQLPMEALRAAVLDFISNHSAKGRIKSTGMVVANFGGATQLTDLLRPSLPGLLFDELIPTDTTDFRTLAARLRGKSVDALVVMVLPEQTVPLLRQLAEQKIRTHIIGGDTFADDTLRREVASLMGKVSYVYGEVENDFAARYSSRFGTSSHLYEAAAGYTAGLLMTDISMKQSKSALSWSIPSMVGLNLKTPIGEIVFASSEERGVHALLKARVYSEASAITRDEIPN